MLAEGGVLFVYCCCFGFVLCVYETLTLKKTTRVYQADLTSEEHMMQVVPLISGCCDQLIWMLCRTLSPSQLPTHFISEPVLSRLKNKMALNCTALNPKAVQFVLTFSSLF